MRLEFDRVVLPASVIPVSGKTVFVTGYRVDREGRLLGRGHPRRDAILWAMPLFWPTKIVTLAARGPRPAIEGETRITVRLMEDLSVPAAASAGPAPGWQRFGRPSTQSGTPPAGLEPGGRVTRRIRYAGVSVPSAEPE
jgi:hypothetical protein